MEGTGRMRMQWITGGWILGQILFLRSKTVVRHGEGEADEVSVGRRWKSRDIGGSVGKAGLRRCRQSKAVDDQEESKVEDQEESPTDDQSFRREKVDHMQEVRGGDRQVGIFQRDRWKDREVRKEVVEVAMWNGGVVETLRKCKGDSVQKRKMEAVEGTGRQKMKIDWMIIRGILVLYLRGGVS